jgi:DNA-binding NtrC family response regulator
MSRQDVSRRCVVWIGRPSSEEQVALITAGWRTLVADSSAGDIGSLGDGAAGVIVADLRRNPSDVLLALDRLMDGRPRLPWIALAAADVQESESLARRLLSGNAQLLQAPIGLPKLCAALARAARQSVQENAATGSQWSIMTGSSPAIRNLSACIGKFAPVELPLLITGETGTGKEMAARALHRLSPRCDRPFAAINCGAMAANLVQSELFGHERGAFTGATSRRIGHFESAAGGTVFLDEIGDLPLDAQTNLLRFLQEGTLERVGSCQSLHVDVRVLAATHVDLEKAVAQGRFREDLFYRLNVLRLRMPPLRERVGDIEPLAQHFLEVFRENYGTRARGFSAGARRAMNAFAWPGNVRELLNRVQRAAVVADDALITAVDLELDREDVVASRRPTLGSARISAEREAIVDCLRASAFNISECARRLRVSRVTVYRLCKKHQLALDELR